MSEEGAHELLVAVVQAFNFKGMKYVYVHCKQEDDSSKHQTYFTMMLEDSDVPVAGETIDLFDGYQIIKKNPRGDCRVPDPNNGGHYFYFHENGKEMSDFCNNTIIGAVTEVNGEYKTYTYPDGQTGKFISTK